MLNQLIMGQKFTKAVLVIVESSGVSKAGSFYARGVLKDNSGSVKFICFDDSAAKKICENNGKPLSVSGVLQNDSYSGGKQIKIDKVDNKIDIAELSSLPQAEQPLADMQKLKSEFYEICSKVDRTGFRDALSWLEKTDYFSAPASANYHGAYEGGLLEHSIQVYKNLLQLSEVFKQDISGDSMIISALFHDVCKTDFYIIQQKNVKKDGVWTTTDYYAFDDKLPLGHGEKSVIMLQKYIELSEDEMLAIRWHMGGWDESAQGYLGGKAISATFAKYPLAVLLHMADMADNYLCGKR